MFAQTAFSFFWFILTPLTFLANKVIEPLENKLDFLPANFIVASIFVFLGWEMQYVLSYPLIVYLTYVVAAYFIVLLLFFFLVFIYEQEYGIAGAIIAMTSGISFFCSCAPFLIGVWASYLIQHIQLQWV